MPPTDDDMQQWRDIRTQPTQIPLLYPAGGRDHFFLRVEVADILHLLLSRQGRGHLDWEAASTDIRNVHSHTNLDRSS